MAINAHEHEIKKIIQDFATVNIKMEVLTEEEIKKTTPLHNIPPRDDYSLIGIMICCLLELF
jgi:hypothetical protein